MEFGDDFWFECFWLALSMSRSSSVVAKSAKISKPFSVYLPLRLDFSVSAMMSDASILPKEMRNDWILVRMGSL